MQLYNGQLTSKKRIKYNEIESNKYYYLRIDIDDEPNDLYILVKEKGLLRINNLEGIIYSPIKIRNDNNEWISFNKDEYDDGGDTILTKKEINAHNKKIMIFEL